MSTRVLSSTGPDRSSDSRKEKGGRGSDRSATGGGPDRSGTAGRGLLRSAGTAVELSTATVQRRPVVGRSGDRYEREADAVARRVSEGRAAPPISRLAPGALTAQCRDEDEEEPVQAQAFDEEEDEEQPLQKQALEDEEEPVQTQAIDEEEEPVQTRSVDRDRERSSAARALRSAGDGRPMHGPTRRILERRMGADLSDVRVHDDPGARASARELGARAFTHGSDVWLGPGASDRDLGLMAHEVTHVVQQGATDQARTTGGASSPVQRRLRDRERPVQRQEDQNVAERFVSWGTSKVSSAAGALADRALDAASAIVPDWVVELIRDIRDRGILGTLRDRLGGALRGLFDAVSDQTAVLETMVTRFTENLTGVKNVVQEFVQGTCEQIFDAVGRVKTTLTDLATEGWEKLEEFFTPIKETFQDLWERVGSPIVQWIEEVGGGVWETIVSVWDRITDFASHLGTLASRLGSTLWEKISGWIGLGGGESEEESTTSRITSWIDEKINAAWSWVSDQLAPVVEPMNRAVSRISDFYERNVVDRLEEEIAAIRERFTEMTDAAGSPDDVVQNQSRLREAILPAVLGAIDSLRGVLARVGPWVSGVINGLTEPIRSVLSEIGRVDFLSGVRGALQWIDDGISDLTDWATDTVASLFDFADRMLVQVKGFVRPVLETLRDVVAVLGDFVGSIGNLIIGMWREIPSCLRDVLKTFLVDQILKRLPFFDQLKNARDAWETIKQTALTALYQVFVDGDLLGAAWTVFRAMLRAVGIPPELVTALVENALEAFTSIFRDPVGFLVNLAKAVQRGFGRFFSNFGSHLWEGITSWLFGALEDAGIEPPAEVTLSEIFRFVFEVLGVTLDSIVEKIAAHTGVSKDRIDRMIERIEQVVEVAGAGLRWIRRLIDEGPGALWEFVQEQLAGLWDTVRESIIGWMTRRIITAVSQRLVMMLDPSGIGAVVNIVTTIWEAIKTFGQYVRELIEMVNTVVRGAASIAKGVLGRAAGFVESALVDGLPVAIGFLANYAGFSDLSSRIEEMVERVRGRVDEALDWLVERAVGAVRRALDALRSGAQRVVDWWKQEEEFSAGGEDHRIFFEGRGRSADLMVASGTPRPLEAFLERRKSDVTGEKAEELDEILSLVREVDSIKTRGGTRSSSNFGKSDGERIGELLDRIAEKLAESGFAETERPASQIEFHTVDQTINDAGERSTDARRMEASVLSFRPASNATGSRPTQSSNLWNRVRRRRGAYVRGHLLNHHVHGPGRTENLTPITGSANTSMLSAVEETVKNEVLSENNVVSYTVEAHYGARAERTHIPEEEKIPTRLSFDIEPLTTKDDSTGEDPGDWVEDTGRSISYTSSVDVDLPPDTPPEEGGGTPRFDRIALNDVTTPDETLVTALQSLDGIGPSLAASIVTEGVVEGPPRGEWTEIEQVTNVRGIGPRTAEALTSDPRVVLDGTTVEQEP